MGKQCKGDSAIVDLGRANHYRLAVPVMCGNYFHAAESGRRCDQMTLSISDVYPCAIQSRPFGLPYGLFFTTQWPESRSMQFYEGAK